MNIKTLLTTLYISLTLITSAQPKYQISLLTCEAGEPAYATFGHTAIRIIDNENNTDLVYNFGLFQFSTPNFAWKYTMGGLEYWLGVHKATFFLRMYESENRNVWEQQLTLPPAMTQKLVDTLNYLLEPKNKYYNYHFLDKNCTTKARDIILSISNNIIKVESQPTNSTYRKILNSYLNNKPWTQAGINIIIGMNTDKPINTIQHMALPRTLMEGFEKLNAEYPQLIGKKELLLNTNTNKSSTLRLFSPLIIFGVLLAVWLRYPVKTLTYSLWFITGIISITILFLWAFSSHMELQSNWNILWVNPLYIVLIITSILKKEKITKWISILNLSALFLLIIVWIAGIQPIHFTLWTIITWLALTNLQHVYPQLLIRRQGKR